MKLPVGLLASLAAIAAAIAAACVLRSVAAGAVGRIWQNVASFEFGGQIEFFRGILALYLYKFRWLSLFCPKCPRF